MLDENISAVCYGHAASYLRRRAAQILWLWTVCLAVPYNAELIVPPHTKRAFGWGWKEQCCTETKTKVCNCIRAACTRTNFGCKPKSEEKTTLEEIVDFTSHGWSKQPWYIFNAHLEREHFWRTSASQHDAFGTGSHMTYDSVQAEPVSRSSRRSFESVPPARP